MSKLPTRTASRATMPPRLITAGLARAAADVDDHVADRLVDREVAPIAAAIGCSISCASAAPARRAASVTARRSTSVIADGTQMTTLGA
jgi:hypothetical protein